MNSTSTPETEYYSLKNEPEYDTPWIAAPNNGGDVGDMSDIVGELNQLKRERDELREALQKIVACGLNCKDALDEAEQMEWIARDALGDA